MFFDGWEIKLKNNPDYGVAACKSRLKVLLWDFNIRRIDWDGSRRTVVQRVIEYGVWEDYLSIFKLYGGVEGVRKIIKDEVPELPPKEMAFVSAIFNLKKEELKCYITRQSRQELGIYW